MFKTPSPESRRTVSSTADDSQPRRRASTSSISDADLAAVVQAVGDVTRNWTVRLSRPFDDEVDLIVSPSDLRDDISPSFVIYREIDGFHVDCVQWNLCETIGVYYDFPVAVEAMIVRLARITQATLGMQSD